MSEGNKGNILDQLVWLITLSANVALLNQATEIWMSDRRHVPDEVARTILKRMSCWRCGKKGKFQADVNKSVQLSHRSGAVQSQHLMQKKII